jgi:Flp pilus assembly protein TadB
MNNLLTRFQPRELELEVEEELRHHVELLQHEYTQRGMSPEEARAATLRRFGNVDRFKNECVKIRRKSRPLQRGFKIFLILLVLAGLIVRTVNTDFHVSRIGDMLIMVAVACRLLLYVRSLTPSRFLSRKGKSSFSIFS